MYMFVFQFADGSEIICKNITVVKRQGTSIEYSGDQILSGYYPIDETYYLFSADATYTVGRINQKAIIIKKM